MREKRKRCQCILTAAILLLLTGCSATEEESGGYTVYYEDPSGTSLAECAYTPSADTFDELMEELIAEIAAPPADETYISALPENVQILGYERGIDFLQIDFTESYYEMDNIEEVLLRAAVVKTFTQIPGVSKIMITVDSEQLVDEDGRAVEAMGADSFIDTKNGGISSYQYATLNLYFPVQNGDELLREVRNVDYSSNMVLERVIVEQLIAGAADPDCRTAVNPSAEILDVSTKNGICTLNFTEEFNQVPTENAPSAEAALYAVVDSICATSDSINGVKFTVDGQSNLLFWDEIDLSGVFLMNDSIVETEAAIEADLSDGDDNDGIDNAGDVTLAGADD